VYNDLGRVWREVVVACFEAAFAFTDWRYHESETGAIEGNVPRNVNVNPESPKYAAGVPTSPLQFTVSSTK
jgi:hypothetical protein